MTTNREIAREKLRAFYKAHFFGESPEISSKNENDESYYVELSKEDNISLWYEWWNDQKVNFFAISVDFDSEKELEDAARTHRVSIPRDEDVWTRKNVVCDRISYQGKDVGPKGGVRDAYAYMSQYLPSNASWDEDEKCLDRFFNHPFVRDRQSFKNLVAERIVANMKHLIGNTPLRLVNENHPIGKDKKVLFIQYKPFFAEETWWKNGYHYEFRITDDSVFIEFHSESNVYEQNDVLDVGLPLSFKKWGKKGFRLSGQNEEIKFSPKNSQDGFVGKAVNRMIEFEKEYGGKILKLIGQEDRSMIIKTLELLKSNYNIILHGAPGTGKTYLARDIASELIFSKQQDELNDKEKALLEERTSFVQFHQSYDYTDFVEGLRPAVGADGKADGFERKDGVFKEFCKLAKCDMLIEAFKKKVDESGANGLKVKSVRSPTEFAVTINQNEKFQVKIGKGNDYSLSVKDIKDYLITGSYDKEHDTYGPGVGQYIKENIDEESYFLNTDNQKPYVFIIDEINRGEMSKIFGELFFSIDPGYRGKAGRIKTQYQNLVNKEDLFAEGFYIPKNVYIIGTMNDIDRSVESMDFAMRRRFAFEEITAEQSMKMFDKPKSWKNENNEIVEIPDEVLTRLKNRMRNLNTAILEPKFNLSQAYQIGGAYFLKFAKYFESYGEYGAFAKLWDNHLKCLLAEYLRGMPKAKELLDKLEEAFKDDASHE